jgi:hypothetical protein
VSKGKLYRISGRTTVTWEAEIFDPVDEAEARNLALGYAADEVCTLDDYLEGKGMTHELTSIVEEEYETTPPAPMPEPPLHED